MSKTRKYIKLYIFSGVYRSMNLLEIGSLAENQKINYLYYFFPIISAGYVYYLVPGRFNLLILSLAAMTVIVQESYHFAYKDFASRETKVHLVNDLNNIGLNLKQNLGLDMVTRMPEFMFFIVATWIMYWWTLFRLWPLRNDVIAMFIILIQIGLFTFNMLEFVFAKIYLHETRKFTE